MAYNCINAFAKSFTRIHPSSFILLSFFLRFGVETQPANVFVDTDRIYATTSWQPFPFPKLCGRTRAGRMQRNNRPQEEWKKFLASSRAVTGTQPKIHGSEARALHRFFFSFHLPSLFRSPKTVSQRVRRSARRFDCKFLCVCEKFTLVCTRLPVTFVERRTTFKHGLHYFNYVPKQYEFE